MSTKTDSVPAIRVPNELSERTLRGFEEAVDIVVDRQPDGLILDCVDLQLVSSNHVNVLWNVRERCEQAKVPLSLRNVSAGLIRILKLLDLIEFFCLESGSGHRDVDSQKPISPAEDNRRYETAVHPESGEILNALHEFRQFLKELKIDPMRSLELETVFYETLTNIRTHGHVDSNEKIQITIAADERSIELTFADGGRAFNPAENVPEHDPGLAIRRKQKHGFGLTMIARMTDSMDYRRVDNKCNVLRLKKYWKR